MRLMTCVRDEFRCHKTRGPAGCFFIGSMIPQIPRKSERMPRRRPLALGARASAVQRGLLLAFVALFLLCSAQGFSRVPAPPPPHDATRPAPVR